MSHNVVAALEVRDIVADFNNDPSEITI